MKKRPTTIHAGPPTRKRQVTDRNVILLVRPTAPVAVANLPEWWPDADVITVTPDGGWVAGVDHSQAFPEEFVQEVKELWQTARTRRRWTYEVRLVL